MKKLFFTFVLVMVAAVQTMAMSRSRSMEEAAYLTDKMIYELGLSNRQTEDVYQINYDYFTQVGYSARRNERAAEIRMRQLEFVLTPNQFRMCQSIIYFLTPAMLYNGEFYFRIYIHYERGVFYFDQPRVYRDYRGAYKNNVYHYEGHRPTGYFFHNGVMSTEPRPMHPGPGQPGGPAMPGQGHRPGGYNMQPGGHPGGAHPGGNNMQPGGHPGGARPGGNNMNSGTATPPPANHGVNPANPNGGQRSGGVTSSRGNGGKTDNSNMQRPDNGTKPANPNNGNNDSQRRTFGKDNNANNRPANAGTSATPARQNTQPATSARGNANANANTNTNTNTNTTPRGTTTTSQSGGNSNRFSGGSTGRRGR